MAEDRLTIALAQTNPILGDIDGNCQKAAALIADAIAQGVDILAFPELYVIGYPPEDLVLKPALTDYAINAVAELAKTTQGSDIAVVIGTPWREMLGGEAHLRNAAFVLQHGGITARIAKHDLPNYGVFDEKRVFSAGPVPGPVRIKLANGGSVRLGVMICEDMWTEDVTEGLDETGAELLLVINGSPFDVNKADQRLQLAIQRVVEAQLPLLYVNQVGGQDELVFDGASFVLAADRRLVAQAEWFSEALLTTQWERTADGFAPAEAAAIHRMPERLEAIYRAMVLGIRDYVEKNRFPGVVLGLSGGVDSALTAAVAVDALGADRVWSVMMPSQYTSAESLEDAEACANLLGTRLDTIAIEPAVAAFGEMLAPVFADRPPDVTEENIQARIRGLILMGISNKHGNMLVTTGNKSEMSVGYATLYGDMCGGYSVLKDVYKTTVFALCHYRNANRPPDCLGPEGAVIPECIITKPPSAELRPDQKDEDSLPAYETLDQILRGLIEEDRSAGELVTAGFDAAQVRQVSNLLDLAEYKRRQAPPGVKLTEKAFGRDRRYPITNAFRRIGIKGL